MKIAHIEAWHSAREVAHTATVRGFINDLMKYADNESARGEV